MVTDLVTMVTCCVHVMSDRLVCVCVCFRCVCVCVCSRLESCRVQQEEELKQQLKVRGHGRQQEVRRRSYSALTDSR